MAIAVETEGSVLGGGEEAITRWKVLVPASFRRAFDKSLADEIVAVTDHDAFDMVKKLAAIEGVTGWIQCRGQRVCGRRKSPRRLGPGKRVATIIPDSAERYLSKDIFHFNDKHLKKFPTTETRRARSETRCSCFGQAQR